MDSLSSATIVWGCLQRTLNAECPSIRCVREPGVDVAPTPVNRIHCVDLTVRHYRLTEKSGPNVRTFIMRVSSPSIYLMKTRKYTHNLLIAHPVDFELCVLLIGCSYFFPWVMGHTM